MFSSARRAVFKKKDVVIGTVQLLKRKQDSGTWRRGNEGGEYGNEMKEESTEESTRRTGLEKRQHLCTSKSANFAAVICPA